MHLGTPALILDIELPQGGQVTTPVPPGFQGWDRSGMTRHRLAILPSLTHYDINVAPALSDAVIPFLDSA